MALLITRGAPAAAPPLPEDGVRDDARILSDANRELIIQGARELHQKAGVRLLVDTATFLKPDTSPAQWIRTLRDDWLADQPGVVVFLTRRSEGPPLVDASPPLWQRYGDPHVYAMMQRATAAGGSGSSLENKLTATVRSLLDDLNAFESKRNQQTAWFGPEERWLAGGLAALLTVAAIFTWFMVRRSQILAAKRAAVKLLPDVIMPTRLGAPGGGGTVVERSYRK